MKNLLALLLALSAGLNVYLLTKDSPQSEEPYVMEGDTRTGIPLAEEHRQFVMDEMRTFMESMQQIHEGLMQNNPEMIIEAAKKSGTGVKPPKELRESLPKEFLQMGMVNHKLFDAIADSAKINFKPELTQMQMNELMNQCVTCHKTYRFDPK